MNFYTNLSLKVQKGRGLGIQFTLIIYKQFNFCRFRASAYTNVCSFSI